MNYCDFMSANNGRLIAHEAKHSDQWAIFGPGFALLDGAAAGAGWGISKFKGGNPGQYNVFEIWAGLKDGGYE